MNTASFTEIVRVLRTPKFDVTRHERGAFGSGVLEKFISEMKTVIACPSAFRLTTFSTYAT